MSMIKAALFETNSSAVAYLLLAAYQLVFLVYPPATLAYSTGQFVVQEMGDRIGLHDATITAILQDQRGLLWIGTPQGLLKYDGRKLVRYSPKNIDAHFAPALDISDIDQAASGQIWLSTHGGTLSIYDEVKDRFTSAPTTTVEAPELGPITKISTSFSSGVLLGTRDGLVLYQPDLAKYSSPLLLSENRHHIGSINDLAALNPQRSLAASTNGLFLVYRNPTESDLANVTLQAKKILLDVEFPTAISHINGSSFWVGTAHGELVSLNEDLVTVGKVTLPDVGSKKSISYVRENNGKLYIGTDNGIWIYTLSENKFQHISTGNSKISNDHISTTFFFGGTSWVGTYNGLNLITESKFTLFNSKNSSIHDEVLAIDSDLEGGSWIGTYDGLFYLPNSQTSTPGIEGEIEQIDLLDRRVMALSVDNEIVWVGTRQHGVFIVNRAEGITTQVFSGELMNAAVTSILHARDHVTWIGTYNHGLIKIVDQTVESVFSRSGEGVYQLPELSITLLSQSKDGKILIVGSERNLYRLSAGEDQFAKIVPDLGELQSAPTYLSLFQSSNGATWLGTLNHGPLHSSESLAHENSPQFKRGQQHSTLSSSAVYAFQEDTQGNIWCSTSSGIYLLNESGGVLKRFGVSDGLQGNDFNFGASHKDHSGRIYFGGSNGYNRFHPEDISLENEPPTIIMTNLIVAGKTPALIKPLPDLEKIELDYTDYYVTFEFSALDYLDPSNNLYRYKLLGFDPDWIAIGNRNSATYTNLPAGKYIFRVQGANAAGVWNRQGISVEMKVNPPPWLSWWAYCVYAFLALVAVWHGKRIYDNYIIREQALLLAREMQEAADRAMDDVQEQLDQQSVLVETIHEFNLQKLDLVRECFERHTDFLPSEVVENYAREFGQRLEALACLGKSLYYKHEVLLADLHVYTESLLSMLLSKDRSESIGLDPTKTTTINLVTSELIPARFALPISVLIYELVANAVSHAFENTALSCFIQIELAQGDVGEQLGSHLKLSVSDNGVGIPANINFESPESEGLTTVVHTVKKMNGDLTITRKNGTSIAMVLPSPDSDDQNSHSEPGSSGDLV